MHLLPFCFVLQVGLFGEEEKTGVRLLPTVRNGTSVGFIPIESLQVKNVNLKSRTML